ncbi:hypothetical protein [Actinophytocola oryzae]|uniref:Uncharacterized protein n=1 Tax=Actinophytocola oryzae TaxID=502181 RepID=A0A4R7VN38_9PSEU|nr:hypothetical protein [Actinophytocola oryzae]TDV51046.1 hypothetical protein CLV71_106397 [Actinophytocola oryzae]
MSTRPFDPMADLSLSPVHKAAARRQLDLLAEQTRHPELRDLARDVLSGRLSLRGALVDPRATAVLDQQVGQFTAWYHELSAGEQAEHERQAEQFAEDARQEAAAPDPRPLRSRPRPDSEGDWEEPRPILRKRRR